jgi:hypothetical protein
MKSMDRQALTFLLKTLADEDRILMIGLMGQKEWQVRDLAQLMQLPAADVFRHLYEMHHVSLLNLRMDGTQDYYRVNERKLDQLKGFINKIDTQPEPIEGESADYAWIDALSIDDEDKKVLRDYTLNGRLTQLPLKEKKWLAVLRWLATKFEVGIQYTEKQVNALLTEVHEDYATIRRNLIEYGFMQRDSGGRAYWRVDDKPSQ